MSKKKNMKRDAAMQKTVAVRETEPRVDRRYKDTVFRLLFQDKKRLLGLYNAVSGRDYKDPDRLEIVTLESAVYLGIKNDLAFLIDMNLYLFEHQSTINENMPLRFLQYVSAEYEKLIVSKDLHRRKLVRIPAPHFLVLYNGAEFCDESQELKLSDAFYMAEKSPELELKVRMLNINKGFNGELKEQCRTLGEYMQYVEKVRDYAEKMPIDMAVGRAVEECIREDILREFLLQNKAEVKHMSIFEYNEEDVRQAIKEDAYEDGFTDGFADGRKEAILLCLEEIGVVPEDLREEISGQTNGEILLNWLKNVTKAKTIEEFIAMK